MASIHYGRDGDRVIVKVQPPEQPPEEIKQPWRPMVGVDKRDLRDPVKLGKAQLRKRRRGSN